MALTVETTLDEIANIHKSKPLFGHPLWTEWVPANSPASKLRNA